MKILKLLMMSGVSYAAMTAHAHAEPVSFAIFSALYTIGIPGAIANAISLIAIPALSVAAAIIGRPQASVIKPTDAKGNFETGESTALEGVGRVRIGGLTAFGNSDGSTRARLVCRLQGPIDAVEAYFIGGREVTVDGDGDVSSPPWSRPGGSWVNWSDKIGTGAETAWSSLISLFPTLWTSAHRVRGIAQSLTLWYNPGLSEPKYFTLYQGGIPVTEQLVRASKVYDPRTGSTAWSENGILISAHVMRRDPAFTSSMFDWDLIGEQADLADELVATKTGTEKRARAWGIWGWESPRGDILRQFMDSIGAEVRMSEAGKIWFELINDDHTSEIDFTPADGYEITWRSGPEAVERPNICRVSYYSPERNYDMAEIDLTGIAWAHDEDEIEAYGPKPLEVVLPFCPSASQAQRIARRKFAQARGDVGVLNANMVGLAAWGLMYGSLELPDLGDVLPMRMEPPRVDDSNGSVEIPFSVWPALPAWDPDEDEADAPDPIPDMGFTSDLPLPDAPTSAIQITYPGGGKELRVAYTLDPGYDAIEATIRTYTGGLPNSWLITTERATFAYKGGDYQGELIDARVRVFTTDEEGSEYSDNLSTTVGTSNTALGAVDVVSVVTGGIGGGPGVPRTIDITVKVPATGSLRISYLQLERVTGGVTTMISEVDARPGEEHIFADSTMTTSGFWRVIAYTSNDTAGTPVTTAYS